MTWLRRAWLRLRHGKGRVHYRIGIYGSPNAGKSTLANALCRDFAGETMGSVSEVPHETRRVLTKQSVTMRSPEGTLVVDVMDTPGLAARVDPLEFEIMYNMTEDAAAKRAAEATQGILEAIQALERLDAMLLVVDAATDPYQQVNQLLLMHVQARHVPMLVVANKMDLAAADVTRLRAMFERHRVVPISAKTGAGLPALYDEMIRTFGA